MIFLKYEIVKKEIKNSYPSAENPLVKYSIAYPEIKGKDGFSKVFNGFYSMLAKRYEDFAKTKLYKESQRYKVLSDEGFEPFGAVLKYVCSHEGENVMSIVIDAYVFCGNKKQESKRMSQNWEKSKGRMLLFEDFFSSEQQKDILQGIKNEAKLRQETGLSVFFNDYEKKLKKGFSKNNFYLTPKGYGFFYPAGYLSENTTPEVFFILGFKGEGEYNLY